MKSLKAFLLAFSISILLLMLFAVLRVIRMIPSMDLYIANAFGRITGLTLRLDAYSDSLFTWEMFNSVRRCLLMDKLKPVALGEKAPNLKLVSTDGVSKRNLLDFAKECRPLVVNFGSCSWPNFRQQLQQFNELVNNYVRIADFIVVYIEEAHPTNGWTFKVRGYFNCIKTGAYMY